MSRSAESQEDEDSKSQTDSLPSGTVNEENDKVNLRKFVAAFAAMNMMGQSDATRDTTPMRGNGVRGNVAKVRNNEENDPNKDHYKNYMEKNSNSQPKRTAQIRSQETD